MDASLCRCGAVKSWNGTLRFMLTAADIGKPRLVIGDTAVYIPGPGRESKYDLNPTARAPKYQISDYSQN